ncbi:MAG: hypothetical protein ABIR30_06335 [Chitinophagaceae bacterium]
MKNSYPDSLITLSAALAMASSTPVNKYDKDMADIKQKESTFLKFNTKQPGLGIKFDNISAGKYFALINQTQRHSTVGMKSRMMG